MLQATAVNTLLHVVPCTPIMWTDGRFTYKLKPQEELLLEKLESGELDEMVEAATEAATVNTMLRHLCDVVENGFVSIIKKLSFAINTHSKTLTLISVDSFKSNSETR